MARELVNYRLADGTIVAVDDSAAKGAPEIDFTLKGGAIVKATRCGGERPSVESRKRRVRSIALLEKTLSMLSHYVWFKQLRPGDHMWSIPVDEERDFNCILS